MRIRQAAATAAVVVAVVIALLVVQNVALAALFPHLPRLVTDFSPAYLGREVRALAAPPARTVLLGDSVVWGYQVRADQTAAALLAQRGCACENLAFKSANPPNYYALALLLRASGVRPKAVVLEVNQRVLNPADQEYGTLHPAVAALAAPLLSPADRAKLALPAGAGSPGGLERAAARASLLYAMRTDVRATLFGEDEPAPARPPAPDQFEGTYDLTPLGENNVGVHFLEEAVAVLRAERIPVIAFLTPTNHALLHEYIDVPEYRANGAFLRALLERRGARVLDLDAAFPAREFIDNDHLTAAGHRRLADRLAAALPR